MRVEFLIDNLGSGGAQRQVVELARALRMKSGVDARIVAYRHVAAHDVGLHGRRAAGAGIPVLVVAKRFKLDPTFPIRLARAIEGADIVQSYMPIPSLWVRTALSRLRGAARPRWIACERTDPTRSSWFARQVRTLAFRHADLVTVNSRPALAALERQLGIPRERLHFVPNGIDLAGWDSATSRPPPWPMPADRFHIVVVGRLSAEKNHRLLLEALARLEPRLRASWTVWLLGAATREPEGEQVVREAVERLGLAEIVEIRRPTPEVAAVIARADLLVLPSRYEGFPNAVLEAMASRTLVVAAPVGEVGGLIDTGRTGLLFRPEDPADLARALASAYALPPAERRAIGEAARRRVETEFRIERIAARHVELYGRLLGSRSGPEG